MCFSRKVISLGIYLHYQIINAYTNNRSLMLTNITIYKSLNVPPLDPSLNPWQSPITSNFQEGKMLFIDVQPQIFNT